MLYTVNTKKSMTNVSKEIVQRAKKEGFGVLKEYHFKEILKEKGSPIQKDIIVYEICNPPAAQSILDAHPEVSVFLPCRISLYEQDNKTTLSTISIDSILDYFELNKDISIYMKSIFDKVKNIINSFK